MESVRKADFFPLEPFLQDGAQVQPVYVLTGTLTGQDYGEYSGMHVAYHQKKAIRGRRINGLLLFAVGLFLLMFDYGLSIFSFLLGIWYFSATFFWARKVARASAKNWDGPQDFLYHFFEDGFECYRDHEMTRRPYTDITEIIFSGDVLYLYVGKIRAYILTREALSSRAGELMNFLEGKTGQQAVRFEWKRKA